MLTAAVLKDKGPRVRSSHLLLRPAALLTSWLLPVLYPLALSVEKPVLFLPWIKISGLGSLPGGGRNLAG